VGNNRIRSSPFDFICKLRQTYTPLIRKQNNLTKAKQPVPEYNTKKGNDHTAKCRGKQHKHSHPDSEPEQAQPYQSPHDSSGKNILSS
jgi:hypothetical protein